jgi:tRNA modification GTPase
LANTSWKEIERESGDLDDLKAPVIRIGNKMDKANETLLKKLQQENFVLISAFNGHNIDALKDKVIASLQLKEVKQGDVLVTNLRHYQGLLEANKSLDRVLEGMMNQVTGDFLAMDIRQSLHHLSEITGEITSEDLLDSIFSKFCIGM